MYRSVFGQKVNLVKLAIFFSPKDKGQLKQSIRKNLGIAKHTRPMHYLEIPISTHHLQRSDYVGFVASIHARIEGWQAKTLSMMARVILVKSVLSVIPIYLLSHTIVPRSLLASIEHYSRIFWGVRT